ncbi:MAG: hypothetical protein LKJ03_01140 [Enterococcaceae bacterium]|nr:hypothetical protein [Enterococcaceae bacterium]
MFFKTIPFSTPKKLLKKIHFLETIKTTRANGWLALRLKASSAGTA